MSQEIWSAAHDEYLKSPNDVKDALSVEVVARLVVLLHLLQCADAQLTPLRWLLFTMSPAGSTRIGHVVDSINAARLEVRSSHIDRLREECAKLISSSADRPGMNLEPVLVVDELQVLLQRSVGKGDETKSLMRAVVDCACLLSLSVVWSGTRLHVMAAMGTTSAFAKALLNTRKLHIVGHFKYLEIKDVRKLLSRVLPLERLADATVSHLCYALQGRGRTCAGFITHLFTPGGPAMLPEAELDDDLVLNAYEDFLSKTVFSRVEENLKSYDRLPQAALNSDELGFLFCRTLLPVMQLPGDPGDRQNCIAFTKSVEEVSVAVEPGVSEAPGVEEVRYAFSYVYGEPTLQEALLRRCRQKPSIADRGIRRMLSSALAPSTLGQYLDYAVVLSLLCRGSLALHGLVAGTNYVKYSTYVLSLDRIVSTSTVHEQLEWFQRVLDDPDDCHFSLLPGVPVKKIVLLPSVLSGTDGICVALPGDQQQPVEHSRKRKDSPLNTPNVVFMHFCCATYEGGATTSKHDSQLLKSGDQFSQVSEKKSIAAQRYKQVAQEYAEKYAVIPVLVEIPGNKKVDPTEDRDVVIVTDVHKGLQLLSQDAIDVLTHSRSASAPSGGPRGKPTEEDEMSLEEGVWDRDSLVDTNS